MDKLSLIKYPEIWGFKRTPRRPKDLWVFNFEQNYDWDLLWYDAVQINADTILLIGPPLYETARYLSENGYFADHSGNKLEGQIKEIDRACLIILKAHQWTSSISLIDKTGKYDIPVSFATNEFRNKKVIVTISKNHPIPWLKQWIDFHKKVHNLDGVIIYNNQSTIYSSEELQEQLSREDINVKIIDFNVPFGCMGGGYWEWGGKSGTSLPWDSDFSQYIMLEHAKYRYLHCAKLAINADTDELLLLKNTTLDSLADYCQSSANSVWMYNGVWVEPIDSHTLNEISTIPFDQRRFENYWHTANNSHRGVSKKWMLSPKQNLNYQWGLHHVSGPNMFTDEITFGHYLPMNTGWSYQRDKFTGNKTDLVNFDLLKKNLDTWKNQ